MLRDPFPVGLVAHLEEVVSTEGLDDLWRFKADLFVNLYEVPLDRVTICCFRH